MDNLDSKQVLFPLLYIPVSAVSNKLRADQSYFAVTGGLA